MEPTGVHRVGALLLLAAVAITAASGVRVGADSALGEKAAACILFGHDPGRAASKPTTLLGLGAPVEYSARTTSDRTIALVAVGRASVAWNASGGNPEALEASVRAEQQEREAAERALQECPTAP